MASCAISGPSSVTRALGPTWRASVASALIRSGQCVFVVGADPVDGLELRPATSFELYGGADPPWVYRIERAGHRVRAGTRTTAARFCIYAGRSTMVDRGWVSVRYSTRAIPPVLRVESKSDWAKNRARPSVAFTGGAIRRRPRRRPTRGAAVRHRPRARASARGRKPNCTSGQSGQRAAAGLSTLRFGANPPDGLIQLRDKVTLDVGAACGVPARYSTRLQAAKVSAKHGDNLSRQRLTVSAVDLKGKS